MSRESLQRATCIAAASGTLVAEVLAIRAAAFELALPAAAWHVLASVLAATVGLLAGMDWLELIAARPAGRAALVAFLLTACLPGIGACLVALVIFPGMLCEQRPSTRGVVELALCDCGPPREGDAGESEEDPEEGPGSSARSVRAVMAAASMDSALAVPAWKRALRDEREEVRLLAHALLERREKSLSRIRDATLARLAPSCARERLPDACRHRHLLRVADVSWELVRSQLVHDELADEELNQVLHFASAAWTAKPSGGSALMLARVALRARRGPDASHWLEEAERFGIALPVLAQLRAEAAFQQRRYAEVTLRLGEADADQLQSAGLGAVRETWRAVDCSQP